MLRALALLEMPIVLCHHQSHFLRHLERREQIGREKSHSFE
jgi:hypothetical protein